MSLKETTNCSCRPPPLLQAPLFVDTKMASRVARARRFSPFVPTSDAYARAAVRWIGHGALCVPNAGHRVQRCLAAAVPDRVHDWLRLREHLRQRALFQRIRSARAPPRNDHKEEPPRHKF
jgi:17beta-estradiol 17-dehydrogenase / very-long-chain 3-oxoacyl-CoA reductase